MHPDGRDAAAPFAHVDTVLLDLDDTLVDAQGAWRAAFCEVFEHLCELQPGLAALGDPAEVHDFVFRELVRAEHRLAGGGEWDNEYTHRAFARILAEHGEADTALAQQAFERYYRRWPDHVALFRDALPTLEALRGRVRLGLVSNGLSREQRLKVTRLGLEPFFDVIVVSEEVGALKPEPAIFHHALASLGSTAATALYAGDFPPNDVAGARAAEIAAVWVNRRRGGSGGHEPDAEVASLAELPGLLGLRSLE